MIMAFSLLMAAISSADEAYTFFSTYHRVKPSGFRLQASGIRVEC